MRKLPTIVYLGVGNCVVEKTILCCTPLTQKKEAGDLLLEKVNGRKKQQLVKRGQHLASIADALLSNVLKVVMEKGGKTWQVVKTTRMGRRVGSTCLQKPLPQTGRGRQDNSLAYHPPLSPR